MYALADFCRNLEASKATTVHQDDSGNISKNNDSVENVPKKEAKPKPSKFGSLAKVKIIPYDAESNIWEVMTKYDIRSYAIVACYEIPPSRKLDVEKGLEAVLDWGVLPVRVSINSSRLIPVLASISGTSMGNEPCMQVTPQVPRQHKAELLTKWKEWWLRIRLVLSDMSSDMAEC